MKPAHDKPALPDLLLCADGSRVQQAADWPQRRREIADSIIPIEYGGLPPTPPETGFEMLHESRIRWLPEARYRTVRVLTGGQPGFSFMLYLTIPPGDGPFPVVLNGDGCWRYVTEQITTEVIGRGFILAQFNRVEIVPDVYSLDRTSGLYRVYPEGRFGALAAWAWGYHRCVDVLERLPEVDRARIAITGHSRGGKTALLAGATDERIALTNANNSGAGGAGCFRFQAPKSETLADLMRNLAYWFDRDLKTYIGRENELPFDQHFLKAMVAPRALLTTEALGDLWANPPGTMVTHLAAREVYRLLDAEPQLGIAFREGEHAHSHAAWLTLLDFMAWRLCGQPPQSRFDVNPFPEAFC